MENHLAEIGPAEAPAETSAESEITEAQVEAGIIPRPAKLKPKHQAICELKLSGMENKEIALKFDMHPVSIAWVLRQPQCRSYMDERIRDLGNELRERLFEGAVDALAAGLTSDDIDVRLKAADMYLRSQGHYAKKEDEKKRISVEDVIADLLQSKNVQVNINNGTINNLKKGPDDMSVLLRPGEVDE